MKKLRIRFRTWFYLLAIPIAGFGGWGAGEIINGGANIWWFPVALFALALSFFAIQITAWLSE